VGSNPALRRQNNLNSPTVHHRRLFPHLCGFPFSSFRGAILDAVNSNLVEMYEKKNLVQPSLDKMNVNPANILIKTTTKIYV